MQTWLLERAEFEQESSPEKRLMSAIVNGYDLLA